MKFTEAQLEQAFIDFLEVSEEQINMIKMNDLRRINQNH